MYKDLIIKSEESMKKSINFLKEELATIRAGKANPKLIDKIQVSYYGTMTPLNQIANISVPEPRMLLVQPWDANSLKDIERALLTSDLGINPTNDGKVIRLIIPVLTEERRKELLKLVKKEIENFSYLKEEHIQPTMTIDNGRGGIDFEDLPDYYINVEYELVEKNWKYSNIFEKSIDK